MTKLLLYRFDDSESNALIQKLVSHDHSMAMDRCVSDRQSAPEDVAAYDAALVWCLDTSSAYAADVANRIASEGLPVVVIMDPSGAPIFNFHSPFIELCFNPHSMHETLARIRTVIARSGQNHSKNIVHGDLEIDINRFRVTLEDRNIELTYKEYELLKLLARHPGRVFRRDEILSRIWGDDYYGGTRTVDVHIRRLRSKLEDLNHSLIETIWRVGYRFNPRENNAPK